MKYRFGKYKGWQKGGDATVMRKKCVNCDQYTYTENENDDLELFCIYCGEDLTGEPLLPLGDFKGTVKFPTRPVLSKLQKI